MLLSPPPPHHHHAWPNLESTIFLKKNRPLGRAGEDGGRCAERRREGRGVEEPEGEEVGGLTSIEDKKDKGGLLVGGRGGCSKSVGYGTPVDS